MAAGMADSQVQRLCQERGKERAWDLWDSGTGFRPQKQTVVSDNNIIQQHEQEVVSAFVEICAATAAHSAAWQNKWCLAKVLHLCSAGFFSWQHRGAVEKLWVRGWSYVQM